MATRTPRKPGLPPSPPPDPRAAEVARLRARLEEAEQRNRDLLEGSLQGVMVHRDNRILFANSSFAEMFGYADAKAVLKMGDWQQCQAPGEVDRMEAYRAARLRGEAPPARYTFEGRRKDGTPVWVENIARLIIWEGERAILCSMLDITERRKAEVELRRSEERFRIAFENAPVGVGIGFPEVGFVQVNEEYCKFLGWSREDLLKHPKPMQVIKDVTHPDDFETDLNLFRTLMRGEIDSYQIEKRFIRKDGELRWGQLAVSSAPEPDGPRRYVIGHLIDITERKRAEEALRESEERFRLAFENSPLGIALGTPETGWQHTNRAFVEFLGITAGDPVLKTDLGAQLHVNCGPGDATDHERLHRELVAGQRDSFQLEKRYRTPDGRLKWGSLHVATTRNADGSIKWLISQRMDITAQKQAEQALRESEERFRVAFEHAPVPLGLAQFNVPGVQANAAMSAFLGRSREWFDTVADRLQAMRDTTYPEDLEHELAAFERIRRGEGDSYSSERRYLRASGEVRWGSGTVSVTRTPDGRVGYIIAQITDITERKLAEQALRESEARFRIAFENAPIGIALGMAGRGWVQVNPAMEAFLGRDAGTLLSYDSPVKLVKTVTHPEDVGRSLTLLQDMADGKISSYAIEKRYVRPNGDVRWGYHSASCSRDADGRVHYTISLVSDITALKEAQEAYRESEERFRVAFEHAPLAVAVGVPNKGWVQVNDAFVQFLGRSREALMGRPNLLELIRETTHPEDFPANAALFERMAAGEIDSYQMEKRYLLPSGEVRWGFLNVAASRDGDGKLRYTVSQVADITALKQIEQALRDREATLAAGQRITHLGSWRLEFADSPYGRDGTLEWSDEVFRILGLTPGAIAPTFAALREHTHPDDRQKVRDAWEQAMDRRQSYAVNHRVIRADGAERLVAQQSEILYDERTGKPMLARGTIQDVTEQKDLERKLLQSQKLESLGLLAGGIAHDFNNLLTGILGYASLAQQHLPQESPLRNFVSQIEAGGRRAAELCQQMLAYAGRGRFDVHAGALNDIVRDTLPLLEVSIPKKITLTLNLPDALPAVEVDATQIRQIVMNLVTNASDAIGTKAGRITVTTGVVDADPGYLAQTYLSPALPEGRYVFLEVSDTGEGMTLDVQKKIFDPFFTTKFAGRGLGLAAVLGIVRAHHGALKVYSEPGEGTTMRLLLPAAAGGVAPVARHVPPPWQGGGVALVVDDEETVREVTLRMMEALGFTTLAASDGREAVEIYRKHASRIRLVLLDLTMPHMDGEETFRTIRAINASAIVVLMSGFTELESLDRFAGTGLAAFLQKPFSLESLREILQRASPGTAAPA